MSKVIVVGGGPAGMMAAITAAQKNDVILLEQNEKLGKKLYITGKGRCNMTNASDVECHIKHMMHNPRFMYGPLYTFDAYQAMDFFEKHGLTLKVERGNRVYPASDKSSDVIKVFEKALAEAGVKVRLNTKVESCEKNAEGFDVKTSQGVLHADSLVIATGGISYRQTGSTGDGYEFAKSFGHKIVDLEPGLIGLDTDTALVLPLQGLSLKNVGFTLYAQERQVYKDFGEMLFTHFGLSGPIVLSASSHMKGLKYKAVIDLKPKLDQEQLDKRILRDFEKYNSRDIINGMDDLLPKKLIPYIIERAKLDPHMKVHQMNREQRLSLVQVMKGLSFEIVGKHQMNQAIITQGGIQVKEINPATMASKLVEGLYFVGEVIDVDALTGGFNLQVAYATGYVAGLALNDLEAV